MRWLPLALVLVVGCSAGAKKQESAKPRARSGEKSASDGALGESDAPMAAKNEKSLPTQGTFTRKIIYTAQVDLVAEDFTPIQAEVEALVHRLGGYVSHSKVTGSPGAARTGTWTLRVPVEHYAECLAGARALGEVRSVGSDSQDVTEEFYDLEARLRNSKQEEDRLLKLLANATGKLEEILSVEREVTRVRGEIERMEGRKRVLSELIDLSTVHVKVEEIKGYVPEESPTYLTRVRRAFESSIRALVSTATEVSIFLVALAPWLVLLLPLLLIIWAWRRRRRGSRDPTGNPPRS